MTSPLSIDGNWQMTRAEHAGEAAPDLVVEHTTIELANGLYAVRFKGQVVDAGTFELGGVVGSSTLLLRGTSGPNAGRSIPCVFQLRGELLRVCFGLDGTAPTEFSTDTHNQRYLATYRRTE